MNTYLGRARGCRTTTGEPTGPNKNVKANGFGASAVREREMRDRRGRRDVYV